MRVAVAESMPASSPPNLPASSPPNAPFALGSFIIGSTHGRVTILVATSVPPRPELTVSEADAAEARTFGVQLVQAALSEFGRDPYRPGSDLVGALNAMLSGFTNPGAHPEGIDPCLSLAHVYLGPDVEGESGNTAVVTSVGSMASCAVNGTPVTPMPRLLPSGMPTDGMLYGLNGHVLPDDAVVTHCVAGDAYHKLSSLVIWSAGLAPASPSQPILGIDDLRPTGLVAAEPVVIVISEVQKPIVANMETRADG